MSSPSGRPLADLGGLLVRAALDTLRGAWDRMKPPAWTNGVKWAADDGDGDGGMAALRRVLRIDRDPWGSRQMIQDSWAF